MSNGSASIKGARLLITGVASGIGESVMQLAVKDEMRITGVVRTSEQRDHLAKVYGDRAEIVQVDLADRNQLNAFCDCLKERVFDYVLLNAGCGRSGAFHILEKESIERLLDVNLLSNMRMVRSLLPQALEVPTKIVLVSSLIAQMTRADCTSYAVSKAGLSKFYRCLRQEYPALPLLCTEIGPVETPIHEKASGQDAPRNPLIFKPRLKIAQKLYQAMLHRKGLRTLSWDWALMRAVASLRG